MGGHDRILTGRIAIHDVTDLEALVHRVVDDTARCHKMPNHKRTPMAEHLIGTAWLLAEQYQPTHGLAFSTFAYRRLRFRAIDWIRDELRTTRHGRTPDMSLEAEYLVDNAEHPEQQAPVQLERALASSALDPQECSDPDLGRILSPRSGQRPRTIPSHDHRTHGRAAA